MRGSVCPSKERLPCVPPGPRIRFSAAWCSMSRATPASTAVPPCPQAISTGGARLNRNQARFSTDCSHPRRTDGQIDRGLPRKFRVGMSIASYSRAVTYGSNARLLLAPTWSVNQAGREGYRMVRDARISALNSARWSERVPRWKKGQPQLVVATGLTMSGRLDSNQRPPEPHSRSVDGEYRGKY